MNRSCIHKNSNHPDAALCQLMAIYGKMHTTVTRRMDIVTSFSNGEDPSEITLDAQKYRKETRELCG